MAAAVALHIAAHWARRTLAAAITVHLAWRLTVRVQDGILARSGKP